MKLTDVKLCAAMAVPCLALFSLAGFEPRALAGNATNTQGSSLTHRSEVDEWTGQVNVYVGGALPVGTNLAAFQYLFDLTDAGNTTGYITPLLFEYHSVEAFTIFTVVGIGKGFEVKLRSVPQQIPFEVIEGTRVPTSGNFTFGYINAMVDSSGVPLLTSPGTVDVDNPTDGGLGAGGVGTRNDWLASNSFSPTPIVGLGTTFGAPGANTDYTFFLPYRTYSAQVFGIVVTP